MSGAWTIEKKQAYAYDAELDYLTQAKYDDDGNGTWDATHNWTYDVAGNRDSDSSNTGTWAYDALNRLTSSPSLAYENDILGNRIWQNRFVSTSGMRMEWDVVGRMTSACKTSGGARYEYRADGMRIKKVEGLTLEWQEYPPEEKMEEGSGYYDAIVTRDNDTTRYRYDGQMLFEDEYTRGDDHDAFVDVTRNGLGARGIDYIAKTTSSGTTVAFPIYDGHGNMVATLGRNGTGYTLGDQRHYDAWGKIRSGSATGDPKGRHVANLGHVQDDESGLIYMRARYYEPSTGRFVSEDSAKQGDNWLTYCGNDPVNMFDESGNSYDDDVALLAGRSTAVMGLLMMIAGALTSGIARRVAAANALWLITWFGFLRGREPEGSTLESRLIGGVICAGLYQLAGQALTPPEPVDGSPVSHVVGIVLQHAGMLEIFIDLELFASGY